MALASYAFFTLAELKSYIGVVATDDDRDATLEAIGNAACRFILDRSERELAPAGSAGEDRRIGYKGGRTLRLAPWDIRSIESIVVDPDGDSPTTLVAGTDYIGEPVEQTQGVFDRITLARELHVGPLGVTVVEVTGEWGFPAVPADARTAALRLADAVWEADVAPGATDRDFGEAILAAVPNDVLDTCDRLSRGITVLGV